ncbi:hypothetical protein AC625_05325 [Peribacillus loiseleuriae]|uniref:Uncharacterized protein n=1 Tax=Peribacillus loiseleuriae TaxID=1679170 RepID=A0A0K9GRY0_9BACI|nr:hypothetical protein AC625_05325 [Peribacillus loiseleuriae]
MLAQFGVHQLGEKLENSAIEFVLSQYDSWISEYHYQTLDESYLPKTKKKFQKQFRLFFRAYFKLGGIIGIVQ